MSDKRPKITLNLPKMIVAMIKEIEIDVRNCKGNMKPDDVAECAEEIKESIKESFNECFDDPESKKHILTAIICVTPLKDICPIEDYLKEINPARALLELLRSFNSALKEKLKKD